MAGVWCRRGRKGWGARASRGRSPALDSYGHDVGHEVSATTKDRSCSKRGKSAHAFRQKNNSKLTIRLPSCPPPTVRHTGTNGNGLKCLLAGRRFIPSRPNDECGEVRKGGDER